MRGHLRFLTALLLGFALVAGACGSDDEEAATTATTAAPAPEEVAITIAFIYDGMADDGGWNQTHDIARQYVEDNLPGAVITTVEEVSPGSQFQAAFEDFGEQGYDLVICTTYCMDDIMLIGPNYPETVYLSWAGWMTADNVGHYDGATEDGRYLDGLVAGSTPGVDLVGYSGAFPIEEVVRGINAFMIGAREFNPDIQLQVVWTNSWYDPPAELEAAQALVTAGADLLAHELNSPATASVAESAGIGLIGYGFDASATSPNTWLSSFTFDWGPYYLSQAQAIVNGTWEPALTYGGLKDGMIGMASFGPDVSDDVKALIEQRQEEIIDGTFEIFAGPIYDNQGNLVIAEGETVPWDERTLCCDWLIEGVIGEIPAG